MPDDVIETADTPAKPAPAADIKPATATPDSGAGAPAQADAGTVLGDPPSGKTDAPVEDVQRWYGDDWRDKLAGSDEKFRKVLDRYGSLEAFGKAGWELRKARDGGVLKPTLGEEASPEEIAAYRKAHGVPEKAEGYDLTPPPEIQLSDADKAQADRFKALFHANNVSPALAKTLSDAFFADRLQAETEMRDAAQEATIQRRAEIRAEYGKDFKRNMDITKGFIDNVIGEEQRNALTDLTLSDGTRLGDHPAFVRMVVQAALNGAGDGDLAQAEFGGGGKSLEDQFSEAIALKFSDPVAYASEAHQAKLFKLGEAVSKRNAA